MVVAIPIVTLVIFILVMLSGDFLKRPLGEKDNIPQIISNISDDILKDNWKGVEEKTDELETVWKKLVKRVQFSSERDEINSFDTSIARLRGAIKLKNREDALMEISEALEHWKDLGR
jgi:restriction endonuclease